ncbi:hypothetical protein PAXRUDRAFT_831005 [Paxillus rubicundulus Ve08.2h10]|uniref:non-specific serine/threonine protein kinase n=1 Tax=Paxillus rubicundulus Ve08.2h10 TaxID=930991 RepID=A0A0D0DSQ0_9AGAM|nr:hypothetical protein PAXRUDRAFT_831005 [Paxillus rubicundulus Ve08.2h10]
MSNFLELYEPLDIIGNGSFGIIRKVRRKSDGLIFARKELNFERMSERDRKQIVAEVNILKDLDHEHIVRYHDRHVDREAGILYILMEYCGGGDLSTVIKQALKHNRPVPEDTIWNYFMQTLLALQHCHHPLSHARSGSSSDGDGKDRRPQILHRDLKPDNVFLDENHSVKLGDFGLSKALAQASFANTYVGTPYYMSPELMQEKAYDSKSDIWSLGCLIYELCALKPPFHEAKTHAELSISIRNGRIPPLPRGYSQALSNVIKAMLNLNPAMRPSATQLLQHERLLLTSKVAEAEKMLTTVKAHKAILTAKEREVSARETALAEREARLVALVAEKDAEILRLRSLISIAQSQLDERIRGAVGKREEELRIAVRKREEEVAAAMSRREEEIMAAVRQREQEIFEAWQAREAQIKSEGEAALTEKMRCEKRLSTDCSNMETPISRNIAQPVQDVAVSAMKGVILTQTGQPLATPTPAELANLWVNSPKIGLGFAKIFEFESEGDSGSEGEIMPPSPTIRERPASELSSNSSGSTRESVPVQAPAVPPTRLRKPSIRSSVQKSSVRKACPLPTSTSDPTGLMSCSRARATKSTSAKVKGAISSSKASIPLHPTEYNLSDEENLPSPFLRRVERERTVPGGGGTSRSTRRPSTGKTLRAVAAVNSAIATAGSRPGSSSGKCSGSGKMTSSSSVVGTGITIARPSVTNARKASEDAKKVLSRS